MRPPTTLVLVLHGHIPDVLGHGTWPHGANWLYEAAAETYLPFLRAAERLLDRGILLKATVGMTPVLCEQLADARFGPGFDAYLAQRAAAARATSAAPREGGRRRRRRRGVLGAVLRGIARRLRGARGRPPPLVPAARGPRRPRDDRVGGDARVSPAPPERPGHRAAARRRPRRAREALRTPGARHLAARVRIPPRRLMGLSRRRPHRGAPWPRGLPRAAPGRLFLRRDAPREGRAALPAYGGVVEAPEGGSTPYRLHAVRATDGGRVAVLARDPLSSQQVWSGKVGYPGDGRYLEFHKKRAPSGHRYWRRHGLEPRPRGQAAVRARVDRGRSDSHATHFVQLLESPRRCPEAKAQPWWRCSTSSFSDTGGSRASSSSRPSSRSSRPETASSRARRARRWPHAPDGSGCRPARGPRRLPGLVERPHRSLLERGRGHRAGDRGVRGEAGRGAAASLRGAREAGAAPAVERLAVPHRQRGLRDYADARVAGHVRDFWRLAKMADDGTVDAAFLDELDDRDRLFAPELEGR